MTTKDTTLRERLANERTLLAWIRTAVALMGFGLVMARFGLLLESVVAASHGVAHTAGTSRWIGVAMILSGSAIAWVGRRRTHAYAELIGPLHGPSQSELDRMAYFVIVVGLGLAIFVSIS